MNLAKASNLNQWNENTVNLVAEGTRIKGRVVFDQISRVHGVITGEVQGKPGSTVILGETGVVEGNIDGDTLVIDGYVNGNITAKSRVIVSRTGRVIGNIRTPNLSLEFGSFFEGRCAMESSLAPAETPA